jgi:ABC-type dipeptide/oligopeptide/nickel transport system permease component
VNELILNVLPYTIELVAGSIILGIIIGLPLGIVSALKRNSFLDYFVRVLSLIGVSFPVFFIGAIFLILFSYQLNLFPIVGVSTLSESGGLIARLHRLFLPAFTLGLVGSAYIMRITRSSLLRIMNEKYIVTARSKGLKERSVIVRHAMRNALISVTTVIGLQISVTIGGTILTEIVFSRPGLGRLLVGAIDGRDYTLIQSGLLILAFTVVIINLLVDLTYSMIDPRIKYE